MQRSTYDEIADDDLEDLGSQTGMASEQPLQHVDQGVPQWRADECAVHGHLGHARGEVVPVLVAILRDPGSEEFLEGGEGAGREHLGT